jgi:hypothetical protein
MYYALSFDSRNMLEKAPKLLDRNSYLILSPNGTDIVRIVLIVVVLIAIIKVLVPCVRGIKLSTRPVVVSSKRKGYVLTRHIAEFSAIRLGFSISLIFPTDIARDKWFSNDCLGKH